MRRIVISVGEPAGIGPDIVLSVLNKPDFLENYLKNTKIIIVASKAMMEDRARVLNLELPNDLNLNLDWIDIPTNAPVIPGKLDKNNSKYVLACLKKAAELCESGQADALVTGPIHKGIINDAGFQFSGHTEFLRDSAGVDHVVMMLASGNLSGNLKVALVTTHIPVKDIIEILTPDLLIKTIKIIAESFREYFDYKNLNLGVCGLNPHAGENGYIGREEIDWMRASLEKIRVINFGNLSLNLEGPLPADSIFNLKNRSRFDLILAMYHDQGLAPFKALSFGEGVNITLGLPYLRTSVDHGTALDLAGTGKAEDGSLQEALKFALGLN